MPWHTKEHTSRQSCYYWAVVLLVSAFGLIFIDQEGIKDGVAKAKKLRASTCIGSTTEVQPPTPPKQKNK